MAAKKKQKAADPQAKRASAPPVPAEAPPATPAEARVKVAKQEYKIVPTQSVKLHPKNPKKGNVDAIGQSLEKNDFYGAIIVQKSTGFILAGNHRWKSAVEKDMREVPVIVVDVDDDAAERILLADNRIADLGTYDESMLMQALDERSKKGDIQGTGYGDADLERMKAKMQKPTEFPVFEEQTVHHSYTCPRCNFVWS